MPPCTRSNVKKISTTSAKGPKDKRFPFHFPFVHLILLDASKPKKTTQQAQNPDPKQQVNRPIGDVSLQKRGAVAKGRGIL